MQPAIGSRAMTTRCETGMNLKSLRAEGLDNSWFVRAAKSPLKPDCAFGGVCKAKSLINATRGNSAEVTSTQDRFRSRIAREKGRPAAKCVSAAAAGRLRGLLHRGVQGVVRRRTCCSLCGRNTTSRCGLYSAGPMAQPRRSKLPRRLGRAPVAFGAAPVPDKIRRSYSRSNSKIESSGFAPLPLRLRQAPAATVTMIWNGHLMNQICS